MSKRWMRGLALGWVFGLALGTSAGAGGATAPGQARGRTCTTCTSVKASRPHGPPSTPTPLHLRPPDGWPGTAA